MILSKIKNRVYFLLNKKIKRVISTVNHFKTRHRNKDKIFVIGFNKTGTTTLKKTLSDFGYICGNQRSAEFLMRDVFNDHYETLKKYCNTAEAFQDVPFSNPEIFKLIDKWFPNSKFILTVRDDDAQWYNSLINFHSKLWGKNGVLPNESDLKNAFYVYKGFPLEMLKHKYGDQLYNELRYKEIYNKHIVDVKNHFKGRDDKLLIINVSVKEDYLRLCHFLSQKPTRSSFIWKNKTIDILDNEK